MIWVTSAVERMRKYQLFEIREVITLQDRRNHVIPRTCHNGEPMVEVAEVADGQQQDTNVSDTVDESERYSRHKGCSVDTVSR